MKIRSFHRGPSSPRIIFVPTHFQLIITNVDLPPRISNYLENVVRGIDVSAPLPAAEYAQLLKSAETEDAYLSPTADYNGCKGRSGNSKHITDTTETDSIM